MENNFTHLPAKPNIFATLSMFLGIASLICSSILCFILGVFAIPLASLTIIFSILSRDHSSNYHLHAKVGFITSGIAIFISIILFLFLIYIMVLTPEFLDIFEEAFFESYNDMSTDPMNEFLPY